MVTLRRRERELARASRALDAANFFLADVRDALGPYLAVYLLTEREWDAASIGLVMSISTIAGILAQIDDRFESISGRRRHSFQK